jgi:hypothetical protein
VTDHDIQFVLMLVNSATLITLIWYAFETMRLRRVAQDQLEALSKPCLTLWAELRDRADAIVSSNQAVGTTVVRAHDASFVVQNVGNGPALNVRYRFRPLDVQGRKPRPEPSYLQMVIAGEKVPLPEPVTSYIGKWELVFRFESFGGNAYESVVTLNERVLVGFQFEALRGRGNDFF